MRIDIHKRHIETEKRFYKNMNKQRSFLISFLIVLLGSLVLYFQYWSIHIFEQINLLIWTLIVVILFVVETMIGYSVFEHERKKYTGK